VTHAAPATARRLLRIERGDYGTPRFAPLGVPLRAELAAWLAAGPCDALPPAVRAEIAAALAEPPSPHTAQEPSP